MKCVFTCYLITIFSSAFAIEYSVQDAIDQFNLNSFPPSLDVLPLVLSEWKFDPSNLGLDPVNITTD